MSSSASSDLRDQRRPSRPPLQPTTGALADAGASNLLRSTFDYFTEPVTYTFSGIVRRLSEDQAPTALARALSANYNTSMTDPSAGMFHAPKRHLSPFQPPPLTALTLKGWNVNTTQQSRLLKRALAEEIRLLIPARLQLADHWNLVYSLEQNGSTLSSLYTLCDAFQGKRSGFVVVVRDAGDGLFGAYLTDAPKPQPHYFGSGECFLWRAIQVPAMLELANLPPPPSANTTHLSRMTTISAGTNSRGVSRTNSSSSLASLPNTASSAANGAAPGSHDLQKIAVKSAAQSVETTLRFKAFPYTGENDFSIFCDPKYLSVGGGNGHYGLWLDDTLSKGVSAPCPTFGNEALSDEGTKFDVLGVEVWYIGS